MHVPHYLAALQQQSPQCALNMISATMQYYCPTPGQPTGYGKAPRNATMSYYTALADPLPSPTFLPTPPAAIQSPILYTTRAPQAKFFPQGLSATVSPRTTQASEAAATLIAFQEQPVVHAGESSPECKSVSPIKLENPSPSSTMTPPPSSVISCKEVDSSTNSCSNNSTEQNFISSSTHTLGRINSTHEYTSITHHHPSFSADVSATGHIALQLDPSNLGAAYAHTPTANLLPQYPTHSYPQTTTGYAANQYATIRYPHTHPGLPCYFPQRPREETFPRNNSCHICGKTYARQSTLKTHLRSHSGEKPYQCSICQKSFTQAANLTAHLRTHTGDKPFKCPVCNRGFSQSSSVTTHMRTHSGDRPYKCSVCGKGFADSSTLTKHYRTHTGEKPYQCKICEARFSQSGNLNRHMRTHRGHFQSAAVLARTQ